MLLALLSFYTRNLGPMPKERASVKGKEILNGGCELECASRMRHLPFVDSLRTHMFIKIRKEKKVPFVQMPLPSPPLLQALLRSQPAFLTMPRFCWIFPPDGIFCYHRYKLPMWAADSWPDRKPPQGTQDPFFHLSRAGAQNTLILCFTP